MLDDALCTKEQNIQHAAELTHGGAEKIGSVLVTYDFVLNCLRNMNAGRPSYGTPQSSDKSCIN